MLKVVAFDLFGTVFDMSSVDESEIWTYLDHIRLATWSPLVLPDSWSEMPVHADSRDGIAKLRENFTVVTLSNAPVALTNKLSKLHRIDWDFVVPLEMAKVFKPNPLAYSLVPSLLGVDASEVLMVTANEKFGDLEAARSLGMQAVLIRKRGALSTIGLLADFLADAA